MQKGKNNARLRLRMVVSVALMAALCFTATFINIPVPLPIGNTMVHLGNTVCLVGALLLGGVKGGLAGGIGMAMFDLTSPIFAVYAPFTFVQKFMMGFACGVLESRKSESKIKTVVAVIVGSIANLVFAQVSSFAVNVAIMGKNWNAVLTSVGAALIVNVINAILAAVFALIVYPLIKKAMKSANFTY